MIKNKKREFFQAVTVSVLQYDCTPRALRKCLEKKLDGTYTRILNDVLNKSRKQHPTKQQLYGHLPPISQTIQVKRARHACHCQISKDELISNLLWTPTRGHTSVHWPAKTCTHQLCMDIGCHLEDLPRAMTDKDRWWKRVKRIHAVGTL